MQAWMMLTFLAIVGLIAYGLNGYALTRLDVALSTQFSGLMWLKFLLVALSVSYFFIGKWLTPRILWVRGLAWCSALWLGVLLYLNLMGGLVHLAVLIGILNPDTSGQWIGYSIPSFWWILVVLGIVLWGIWQAKRDPVLKEVSIQIKDLPQALDGLKIVQLSDIHIGPTLGESFAQQLTTTTMQRSPDLIVITGDLVDGTVARLQQDVEPFFSLSAPLGVYFVTGNHEFISEANSWVAYLKEKGIKVLENQGIQLDHHGVEFNLVGVEDWEGAKFPPYRPPSLTKALKNLNLALPTILLAHQPKVAAEASQLGIDLQLSGHTHGGQMFPFSWFIYLDQPYRSGLYRVGSMSLYVSEGTGYWGPPLRIGTRSELTLITLSAPSS